MTLFSHQRSIALGWDRAGRMTGLCLERQGRGFRIAGIASGAAEDLSDQAREVLQALRRDPETRVVIGGGMDDACCADLKLPPLADTDRHHAIRSAWQQLAPGRPERLCWGYRLLPVESTAAGHRVRLIFLDVDTWDRCTAVAASIPGGVDAILPAPAALDPVLADRAVVTRREAGGLVQLAMPDGAGGRDWELLSASARPDAFGAGEQPLRHALLDLGSAAALDVAAHEALAPLVTLALYALQADLARDRRTLPSYPECILPRRHGLLRAVAVLAALAIATQLTIAVANRLLAVRERRAIEQQERQTLQSQAAHLRHSLRDDRLLHQRLHHLEAYDESRCSATLALALITTETSDAVWCQNFAQTGDNVVATLTARADDPHLTAGIQRSPWIRDYRESKRQLHDGGIEYRVTFNMRPLAELSDAPSLQGPEARRLEAAATAHTGQKFVAGREPRNSESP